MAKPAGGRGPRGPWGCNRRCGLGADRGNPQSPEKNQRPINEPDPFFRSQLRQFRALFMARATSSVPSLGVCPMIILLSDDPKAIAALPNEERSVCLHMLAAVCDKDTRVDFVAEGEDSRMTRWTPTGPIDISAWFKF